MKKLARAIITIALLISSTQLYSQEWIWGLKATGDGQIPYDPSTEINVDYHGNITIAGFYQKSFGIDTLLLFTEDDYYSDIFLSRLNKDGEVKWLKHIEAGSTYDYEIGLTTDDDSNIYLAGSKDSRIFASKYDSTGNLIWNQGFNQEFSGHGRTISTDQFDNVYIAGGSGSQFFIAKLDYSGKQVWTKHISVSNSRGCSLTDINVDALGNIYFTGVFSIDYLYLDDFVLEHDNAWGDQTFFGKLDSGGEVVWVKTASGRSNGSPQIAITSDNHLYLSGALFSGITFDNIYIEGICCQRPKPYLAKYTTDGDIVWAKGAYTSYQGTGQTQDIKVDYDGNLYLTGIYFTCTGETCTETDFYLEKYNPAGEHLWRKEIKMSTSDYSKSIDTDNYGNLYNVGYTNSANFIDENQFSFLRTIGIGKLNTGSSTNKRTPRPNSERFVQTCASNQTIKLVAEGENIKWYSDPLLNNLVSSDSIYTASFPSTDTLYVTQTCNQIESWPKEIIVYISNIPDVPLNLQMDTLIAPEGSNFQYQWLYNDDSLTNATSNSVIMDTTQNQNNFSVIISDFACTKKLDYLRIITSSEEVLRKKVSLYPNPTKGKVTFQPNTKGDTSIKVYTSNGKELISKLINMNDAPFLDLSPYPDGVYLIQISNNQATESFRIIKQ
ncbi:T9SS type A sorting domain-containing protein [Arcticibacterium luteifluviistationis]|uniref:Secretion system C-terminal sorting domain-containing protein n=1 Tax=Arcticibacterium luteifluviistationis TaxID=1784714 RepID=A0A2Z4G8D0_9BACT|nr:T9SS type A sorting domain-containing protein [Arcticibacterium luteifluviistationis]AWV97437.1 hypothetical protein DJ013_04325 [Arcticibacterium luteifluviistationis]